MVNPNLLHCMGLARASCKEVGLALQPNQNYIGCSIKMKIRFKRILIGVLAAIALALAGVAVFLLTLDPNAYKGKIQAWVYEHYQRTLIIDGDLEISLFPRIAFAASDIRLSEKLKGDSFVSIDSARFAVAIWPLLSDSFVVDHVAVTGFKAALVRRKEGGFNFDDLIGGGSAEASSKSYRNTLFLLPS
jgi:AsmA protein